jgi:uncharacterized protein YndB with AHSA1/START domain
MASFSYSIDISRPPADVYAYATDPLRFPEWQPDVASARWVTDGPARVGSQFETTRRIARRDQKLTQEITEDDPPRRWIAHGIDGPIRPTGTLTLEPIDGGRSTRVNFEITYEPTAVGKVIMPLVMRQTRAGAPGSFKRLKMLLEHA